MDSFTFQHGIGARDILNTTMKIAEEVPFFSYLKKEALKVDDQKKMVQHTLK